MVFALALFGCSATAPAPEAPIAPTPSVQTKAEATKDVVVAAHDIEAGATLGEDDLLLFSLPADFVPREAAAADTPVVGRTATDRLLKHEIVRVERLGEGGSPPKPTIGRTAGWPMEKSARDVMVIVAEVALPVDHVIVENDLFAVQIWPGHLSGDGVFLSPEHVVGRKVCSAILPNEIVRGERLCMP